MATLTINTPAGEDARIQAAFGRYLGLANNVSATGAQIKAATIAWMKDVVRSQETNAAEATAAAAVVDVNPS